MKKIFGGIGFVILALIGYLIGTNIPSSFWVTFFAVFFALLFFYYIIKK